MTIAPCEAHLDANLTQLSEQRRTNADRPQAIRRVFLEKLGRRESDAHAARARLQTWATDAALRLHPAKTRIVDATRRGGFDFLGSHVERGDRWPRTKSLRKLKDTLRTQTRRTNGISLAATVAALNPGRRGWFAYFRPSHIPTLRAHRPRASHAPAEYSPQA